MSVLAFGLACLWFALGVVTGLVGAGLFAAFMIGVSVFRRPAAPATEVVNAPV